MNVNRTHCCFPSCRSKGLSPPHCEQMCSSQCTDTSCQLSRACKSTTDQQKHLLNIPLKHYLATVECWNTHLELRWDGFFGWKWSYCCPLFPFVGTYKHNSPFFCPPESERRRRKALNSCHLFTRLRQRLKFKFNTHVCLALAVQYFLFLSASFSWPFLQHWPQTNIIFRFGGPNRL